MSINKKLFISLVFILFLSLSFFNNKCFAKYLFENSFTVANLNIDRSKPVIELHQITNTNNGYENYANSKHVLNFQIKIKERNISVNKCNKDNVKFKVNGVFQSVNLLNFSHYSGNSEEQVYTIRITDVLGDGRLEIYWPEGIIEDVSGLKNDERCIDTGIIIDNTFPAFDFQEISIENNKSQGLINCSENIRPVNGWNISENQKTLSMDFDNIIFYNLPIYDYAGNLVYVPISINNATNIILRYGGNDENRLDSLTGGGKIFGRSRIINKSITTIEKLFIRLGGSLDNEFLKGRPFVYTYWGENTYLVCGDSELLFYYGYNPGADSWLTINKDKYLWMQDRKGSS